jgi:hypothetical protein
MTSTADTAPIWPAHVIHVKEDGWVLVNRGTSHGVAPGLRLIVVGAELRELRDLYAQPAEAAPVLRIRSVFELLEVIHAEERCAVAIAARVPAERRPQIYHGPNGELLVWAPLPADFTWPHAELADGAETGAETDEETDDTSPDTWPPDHQAEPKDSAQPTEAEDEVDAGDDNDARPEQEDERWEQALPLNGTNVGDLVLAALPVSPSESSPQVAVAADATRAPASTIFDAGRSYDWLKPNT